MSVLKYSSNFVRRFVWVWNLVSLHKERTQAEGIRKQGAEEDIWAKVGLKGGPEEICGVIRRFMIGTTFQQMLIG